MGGQEPVGVGWLVGYEICKRGWLSVGGWDLCFWVVDVWRMERRMGQGEWKAFWLSVFLAHLLFSHISENIPGNIQTVIPNGEMHNKNLPLDLSFSKNI